MRALDAGGSLFLLWRGCLNQVRSKLGRPVFSLGLDEFIAEFLASLEAALRCGGAKDGRQKAALLV
jgi:hypothetical protein